MKTNTKLEHFSRQLERIGIERKNNLDEKWADIYDCQPDIGFRHRDFAVQFRNSIELEKALGRQFKNRLTQLAGLVGYFGSFCRNYTESKKINVGQGADALLAPVKEVAASFEDILKNKEFPTSSPPPPPIPSIVTKVAGTVDFEDRPYIVTVPQTSKALLGIYRTRRAVQQAI